MKVALQGGLPGSLAVGLGLAVAIEGAVIHLWVAERSQAWAWAITAANIATLAWLWREHTSARHATLDVAADEVRIDAGSRPRCRFPRSAIASVEIATWRSVPDVATDFVNTAKPLEPNVVIALREPVDATLLFGVRKRVSRIGIRVADPNAVLAALGADASGHAATAT
jgi:hypothetical protein